MLEMVSGAMQALTIGDPRDKRPQSRLEAQLIECGWTQFGDDRPQARDVAVELRRRRLE